MSDDSERLKGFLYDKIAQRKKWSNTKGVYVFVYYQLCPNCKEPIVGVKEQEDLDAVNIDIKDLIPSFKCDGAV